MVFNYNLGVTTIKNFWGTDAMQNIFFWGNSLQLWVFAGIVFVALFLGFWAFKRIVLRLLRNIATRTKNDIDDIVIAIVSRVRLSFYVFLSFYLALNVLVISRLLMVALLTLLLLWAVYIIVVSFDILMIYVVDKQFDNKKEASSITAIKTLAIIVKVLLWGVGLMLILSNLGVNVTSLVAGFGIGGIAIALALQSILGDLFSSFAILFDKPFVVGDFIIVDDNSGTVEKIGIKTTRIRASQGEQIIISNRQLIDAQIHNYKRLKRRRVNLEFGVVYDLDIKKLRKIPSIVEKIFKTLNNSSLHSVHLKQLGDSSLIFELIYYVESGEYIVHVLLRQELLFKLKDIFDKESIAFAFPTQTIFVQSDKK